MAKKLQKNTEKTMLLFPDTTRWTRVRDDTALPGAKRRRKRYVPKPVGVH
jgi:hypothetical protein